MARGGAAPQPAGDRPAALGFNPITNLEDTMQKITPFLWYDGKVEEAMKLYLSVFKNSKVVSTSPGPNGSMMSATFELDGQQFIAFNGGPHLKFTPAVSMYVNCETQEEVDEFWAKLLSDGGREDQCGWLQDRFGLSWQIIPSILPTLLQDKDREKAGRAMNAMLQMKKIDIAGLERAAAGG
jgi:predicted 3-demethylubiquinone-9 3-methyltransferase (glyoxalase superfamily)